MNKGSKVFIVGHNDIFENSLYDYLKRQEYSEVYSSTREKLDTINPQAVDDFFEQKKPEYVFLGPTRSGGIVANQKNKEEFLNHNCESQANIIDAAYRNGVKKLLFIASSCIYPRDCAQPIKEEYLLTGPLEETSDGYATARIAGIKLCQDYRDKYDFNAIVMVPAALYGPGDETNIENAHVMGALLAKFTQAIQEDKEEVVIWGTGAPRREFLFVDDFVDAAFFLMNRYDERDIINVGTGKDMTILELAEHIKAAVGFEGDIVLDKSKPDGVKQKFLDSSRMNNLGWKPKVSLEQGIMRTYMYLTDKCAENKL